MTDVEVQLQLDLFQQCKFPEGRENTYHKNGQTSPCGAAVLYERHGCRGPECKFQHAVKIAKQREKKR